MNYFHLQIYVYILNVLMFFQKKRKKVCFFYL